MRGRFTTGLIAGSIMGAAISMMMNPNMSDRSKKRMVRRGQYVLRRTGHLIGDIAEMFR